MPADLSYEQKFLVEPTQSAPSALEASPFEAMQPPSITSIDLPEETGLRLRALDRLSIEQAPMLKLTAALAQPTEAERAAAIFEVIIDRSNLLPSYFLEQGAACAAAVCKIEASGIDYIGRSGSWAGTGFLVSPNILLTNHHVLNSPQVARNAQAIFNYEQDRTGRIKQIVGFRLNPDRLFITSPATELDYTFVWVEGDAATQFGTLKLDRNSFTIVEREFANVIQHPNGDPKMVSIQENLVIHQDEVIFHYQTDTQSGSSGSPVFNNQWGIVGLHHASQKQDDQTVLNEGIKAAAIAAHLEKISRQPETQSAANEVLRLFEATDPVMGFFGSLGRNRDTGGTVHEALVDAFNGEERDIDVGFWNIEWFNERFESKLQDVAKVIVSMDLDIWAFEESSPEATKALVEHLNNKFGLSYDFAASEPTAASGLQTTTVIWNTSTVVGRRVAWPATIDEWFQVDSRNFDDLVLEAVDGKVFNRYPALFNFKAKNREGRETYDFNLVPLHLKAMGEGSKRRRMAAKILVAAVNKMMREEGAETEWIMGGDYNATLASEDFDSLLDDGFVAVSAEDERNGAFSYLKGNFKSLIDHIFLSPNLARVVGADDFFIVAKDRTIPDYVEKISDHRPVLVRLSLSDQREGRAMPERSPNIQELLELLK